MLFSHEIEILAVSFSRESNLDKYTFYSVVNSMNKLH